MAGTLPERRLRSIYFMASPTYQSTGPSSTHRAFSSSTSLGKSPNHWTVSNELRSFQHGSASMVQTQHSRNTRGRSQVPVPQRPYVPHHRQNYFDQFIPEHPITFPRRYGGDGITLTDVVSENFDCIVGRDDPMFANYVGPAISLRLEVSVISAFRV